MPRHRGVAVPGQVDPEERAACVPHREDADGRGADVEADDEVPDERPRGDEILVLLARRLGHDVDVRRVEPERRRGRAVRDEVHPQQLHGDQTLRHSERGGEEDGDHLADVAGDHVPNERLHVVVD
eukprot:29686-Pelagococcus_subviridis.AAC.3